MKPQKLFEPLTIEEQLAAKPVANDAPEKTVIWPVPADAPAMHFKHRDFGAPSQSWPYRNDAGELLFYIARFDYCSDGKPAKTYQPITFCDLGNGKRGWLPKGFPTPRPLYNLDKIAARRDAPVIITEGEKAADAAAILFPDYVATTSPNGSKSADKAEWTPLKGRDVILSPDNDAPGQAFADAVYGLLKQAGAASIKLLSADRLTPNPATGYDLADALADGWTPERAAKALADPAFVRVYLDQIGRAALQDDLDALAGYKRGEVPTEAVKAAYEWPFRLTKKGVEKRVEKKDPDTGELEQRWVWFCSYLEVAADTRSGDNDSWGRLLIVRDRDNQLHEWPMPMSLLAGDGTAYRERLLSLGLTLLPSKWAKEALGEYIPSARPPEKARCVSRLGWTGRTFVFPTETIGG